MKTCVQKLPVLLVLLAISTFNSQFSTCFAQGTAFTYQGRLNANGLPANGLYDFRFKLYFDPLGNIQAGSSFITNAIPVANGLFTVPIDFGPGIFTGSNYWLEVDVKTNNAGSYTVMSPFQPVTPVPYAVFANTASNLSGTLSAAQINGPVLSANISGTYGNAVTLNNSANSFTGSFNGNGANVTNVNAAALNGLNATNFWQLGGNNVAAGQFLGSTNNQPVEIWANGQRAMRLEPNTTAPNVIGGYVGNFVSAGAYGATISGGGNNGATNRVTALGGSIGGGFNNIASGAAATVGGGGYNQATNSNATVPGGNNNVAGGVDSFAAGNQAQALHQGAFVWADSQNVPFASTNNDSFNVRAAGGVRFVTGGAGMNIDGTINGNGGGLTGLNASQLSSGTVPLTQLPAGLVTNNAPATTLTNLTLKGTLTLPAVVATIYSGASLLFHSDGALNSYVGGAGNLTTGGTENTALGSGALFFNGVAPENTAIGYNAMYVNDTGQGNTAVGTVSLSSNIAGTRNTATGFYALAHMGTTVDGSYNTADGGNALQQLDGGNNNIALGYQAGYNLTSGSSNIYVGNFGVSSENNIIRIGTPGIQTTAYIAGTIDGNGGGLTNLAASQVTGAFTNGFTINGSQSGTFNSPVALIQNNNTNGNTSPGLRVVGYGNSPNGVLSVSSQGTGLLAQFGNAGAFVADITTNGTVDATGFNGGTLRVGSGGTTFTTIQSGQAIMPSSSTVQTNFTITFPQAFSSAPKILVSAANDPSFQGVSDTFAVSVSSNSMSAFRVNVVRVDAATGWSQQLRINWQAWQ